MQGWGFHCRIPKAVNENRVAESCHICWELCLKCPHYANFGSLQPLCWISMLFSGCQSLPCSFNPSVGACAFAFIFCFISLRLFLSHNWEGQGAREKEKQRTNDAHQIYQVHGHWESTWIGFLQCDTITLLSFPLPELDSSWGYNGSQSPSWGGLEERSGCGSLQH